MENSMKETQNIKMKLSNDLAVSLQGIYPKEIKTLNSKSIRILMFTAALSPIANIWNNVKCLALYEQIKKL